MIVSKIQRTYKRTYRINKGTVECWLLICDIVTLVQVIVCKIQHRHKRTHCINKGTVECLVVDM